MATRTVGTGQAYATIAAAVEASNAGDTIDVQAGTYTNDFVTINHDLTLNAIGGTVTMVATEQPPDGKAIIDEGGSGVNVAIIGFDISGATVPDGNGAAIRYEGGALTLTNDSLHGNQDGLLGAADPNGSITINQSSVTNNGTGDGYTHNIYVGDIASLTVENSTITGAKAGHEIKSRAESNTIINNVIADGSGGTASYEIDLPNGGAAVIQGNVIEKGANAENPTAISYGGEGSVYANSSLTVSGNTVLSDDASSSTKAIVNDTSVTASITGNSFYGWSALASGAASLVSNTVLTTEPSLTSLAATLLGTATSTTTSSDTTSTATASSATAAVTTTNPVTTTTTDPASFGFGTGSGTAGTGSANHTHSHPSSAGASALIDQTSHAARHMILPSS